MKIAITGGTGCMGMPLLESLIAQGFCVRLLALPQDERAHLFKEKVEIVTGELNSSEALDKLTKGAEVVFHLAGKVHAIPKRAIEEQEFFNLNVEGTKLLLAATRMNRVRRLVFYSTVAVYGENAGFGGDERSPCYPQSPYGMSKHIAEQLVLKAWENGGVEGVVLRFPVAYGPWDRGNVASLIKAISRKRFFYPGDGTATRSMISSRNAAEAAIRAGFSSNAKGQVFCVTDGRDYDIRQLVEAVCVSLEMKWGPLHVPLSVAEIIGRIGGVTSKLSPFSLPINSEIIRKLSRSLTFSCEKAKRELGYEPKETLREGISREVEWLKALHGWK